MQPRKYIAYYRVSTQKQGASGLGLEAQHETVARYLGGSASEGSGSLSKLKRARVPMLSPSVHSLAPPWTRAGSREQGC